MLKKEHFSVLFLALGVFLLGGLGGVYMNNYVIPKVLSWSWVAEKGWFDRAAEQTTVIEKTEEITVREDDALDKIFAQPATAVVTLIYPSRTTGSVTLKEFTAPGFFVTNDGVIASYNTEGSSLPTPRVILNDGQKHEVELVGVDTYTDIVFYKIKKAINTPIVQFANSDDVRVGKKILLVKNAEVANQSIVDLSILSGHKYTFSLSNTGNTSEKWEGVFALHTPEASQFVGAPAITYSSEVIGMVGKVQNEETKEAQYFILPANVIKEAVAKAVEGKLLTQAYLGTSYISLSPLSVSESSLAREQGALITDVTSRNAVGGERFLAKKMGLKKGDTVIAVDGTEVTPLAPLVSLIYPKQKGDELTLRVIHEGQEKELKGIFE